MMQEYITSWRLIIFIILAFCLVMSTYMMTMKQRETEKMVAPIALTAPIVEKSFQKSTPDNSLHYIKQRNELSIILNEQKKMYGQQSCKMFKLRRKLGEEVSDRDVSENGGWCQELSGSDSSAHKFDEGFAKSISKFLQGKIVGSFGDGPGLYKKALDSYQEVASYTAYDGAPFCETTTNGRVKFLDLSGPQFGLPAFDWVVSTEVGEHIPAQFENTFLDNLARHAKEGLILSWALPGQGGLSHVNNQPLDHVIKQMNDRGFDIDKQAGEPLRQASTYYWLKANIHVYKRIDPKSFQPQDV